MSSLAAPTLVCASVYRTVTWDEHRRALERIEELEQELADAKGVDVAPLLQTHLQLPPRQALVLAALYRHYPRPRPLWWLGENAMPPSDRRHDPDGNVRVAVSQMRRRLPAGWAITSVWGHGYQLSEGAHRGIAELLARVRAQIEPATVSAHQNANEQRPRGLEPCSRGGEG